MERELEIQRLISIGVSGKSMFESVAKKFKVSPSTIKRQYYQIVEELGKQAEEGRKELRSNLMARNDYIFKQSLADGKYKTALDANMAQAKLGGLFDTQSQENEAPTKINILEGDNSGNLRVVGEDE